MMKKRTGTLLLTVLSLALSPMAVSKEKAVSIKENSSGLSADQSENIARTAVSMGVKEPVSIRKSGSGATVGGASSASCDFKLSKDAQPKILGVSCK